jgi:asparagine synthetase B (glutamine-hydrolysing)
MFLLAITKNELTCDFENAYVERVEVDSPFKIIVVTDGFLARCVLEVDRFSLIEALYTSSGNPDNVIFSQVQYNAHDKIIHISRPTVAGRPIYYQVTSDGDFFCSTHVSMFRKIGVSIEENVEVLPEFFVYRYIMPPQTLYKNINQLGGGDQLSIRLANGRCEIKIKAYNPPVPYTQNNTIDDIASHTLAYLRESIQALSPYKDRLSVLLSGGLDSSILFKMCQVDYKVGKTFSTGYPFEDPENNREKEYALSAAEIFGTAHQYYRVTTEEYLQGVVEAISIAEEPLHHLQSVMFHLLFQGGLSKSGDIVISGQGADGVFGLGFHSDLFYYQRAIFRLLSKHPILNLAEFATGMVGVGKGTVSSLKYYNRSPTSLSDPENVLWSLGAFGSVDWVCQYFNVTKSDIIRGRYNSIELFKDRSLYDLISLLDFLGDVCITQSLWSKLGERQKKIVYYPFNNIDMLNYVYSIPWKVKLRNPKNILRGVARKVEVPESIITRPKCSFGVNPGRWAKMGGAFEPLVLLALKTFDEKAIRAMQSVDSGKAMTYWNILNYAVWKRLFIDNEPLQILLDELNEAIERVSQ